MKKLATMAVDGDLLVCHCALLDTVPLNRKDWYVVGFATVAPVVIVEITKLPGFIRSRSNAPSA